MDWKLDNPSLLHCLYLFSTLWNWMVIDIIALSFWWCFHQQNHKCVTSVMLHLYRNENGIYLVYKYIHVIIFQDAAEKHMCSAFILFCLILQCAWPFLFTTGKYIYVLLKCWSLHNFVKIRLSDLIPLV